MINMINSNCPEKLYCLFDANVIAAYYSPLFTRSARVTERARTIIESVRSGVRNHFFYIPNICIAEVFSVFVKYVFSKWNRDTKKGRIDRRVYNSLKKQFQSDIHNAKLFYHYELSRYHILAINLVAPIDHYYKIVLDNSARIRSVLRDASGRMLLPIDQEIATPNRHDIDNIVFDVIGLSSQERDAVYDTVIELVSNRLNKAVSIK